MLTFRYNIDLLCYSNVLQCLPGLVCFQRASGGIPVPGCFGGAADNSRTDYCINPNDVVKSGTVVVPPAPAPIVSPTMLSGKLPHDLIPLKYVGIHPLPPSVLPLQECEGDCQTNDDCGPGLICLQRNKGDPIPGCAGNIWGSRTDYCIRQEYVYDETVTPTPTLLPIDSITSTPTLSPIIPITSTPTAAPIVSVTSKPTVSPISPATSTPTMSPIVPETSTPTMFPTVAKTSAPTLSPITQYPSSEPSIAPMPTKAPVLIPLKFVGDNLPPSLLPLGECEGDCRDDSDCQHGLVCFQRDKGDPLPGCRGDINGSRTDYCVNPINIPEGYLSSLSSSVELLPPEVQNITNPFRLKLYWQEDYFWQESHVETFWCMQCRHRNCQNGFNIFITYCAEWNQHFIFEPLHEDSNEFLIRLSKSASEMALDGADWSDSADDLCFERVNSTDINMASCNRNRRRQLFKIQNGSSFSENRFEITQPGFEDYCITQRHHPKDDEVIVMEPCYTARVGQTSYWVTY